MELVFCLVRCWSTDDENRDQVMAQNAAEAEFEHEITIPARALGLAVGAVKRTMRVEDESSDDGEESGMSGMVTYRQSASVFGQDDLVQYMQWQFKKKYK